DKKHLLIVAEGALQYVPFAALPSPTDKSDRDTKSAHANYRPLIIDHEIVNLPSASTLAVLRREMRDGSRAMKPLLVFADPVFEPSDSRVKNSSRENTATNSSGTIATKTRSSGTQGGAADLDQWMQRLVFSRDEAVGIQSAV